ncbi:hypothetical protein GPU96_01g01570 [Encephalitozoon hellem]|uniref:Uncharacterized protein n=1 Tax=Encephalitozoon hellem TaxID=27973 RepID=A0A9Q9CAR9_ENCHE|nr:hypothetical protein GPU96_01g01570 [Encephalitozoon hellem]
MNSKTLFLFSLSFLAKALATSGDGNGGDLTGGINKAKEMLGDKSGGGNSNPLSGNSSQLGECEGDGNNGNGNGEDE